MHRRSFQQVLLGFVTLVLGIGSLFAQPALLHRYSFDSDASDTIGAAHGSLLGGAAISNGAVLLNGSSGYVDLPNGLVSTLTNATFEVWLTDNGSAAWSRIFDFGFSTGGEGVSGTGTNYLFLCPQSGSGILRASIRDNSLGGEQGVDWVGTRLPTNSLQQVVWTLDADTQVSRLYVNGVPEGTNSALTRTPAQLGYTINNWLGRSQWPDPYLKASITEFRIYDGALSATEVLDNYTVGPDFGPVELTMEPESQTVMELAPATFTINHRGSLPVGIQWRRNGVPIEGATNRIYTIASTALTNHGAAFSVVITNSYTNTAFSVTSSNAVLSVTADLIPPQLLGAVGLFPTNVLVTFSEALLPSTATNPANYVITHIGGSLAVTKAEFGGSASNIVLTTAAQVLGTNYTLTVNGICDLASAANLIATNSQVVFVSSTFFADDLGNPAVAGGLTEVPGGMDLTAGGTGFGGTNDQGYFAHRTYSGNFDVSVRVAALEYVSTRTLAGLMTRTGLASNAPFAASFASPGTLGCYFAARGATNGATTMSGAFPVNYPDTWLRLRRGGNTFSGYASLDGQDWSFLGATNLSLPATVEVGVVLASGAAATAGTAQFRDFGGASGTITTNAPLDFEPAGPSSRRTALVISEIMYNPPDSWGGTNNLEFVEIWNSGLITEDLTGHTLKGEIDFAFPANTKLAPGQFLVVAKDPAAAQSVYGVACLGPYTGKLANGGGTLRLVNELGGRLLEVEYDNQQPWPVAADGTGHSIVLARPSYGEGDPRAWSLSDVMGGSPGAFEHHGTEPARAVVINEFLAHTDLPQVDYIELFNAGTQPVDLSGAWLSDEAGTNKYRIADGTTIAARGWLAFTDGQLGFALSAEGERIFLVNSNQTRVLDAVNFEGQENGVSMGRYPDGAPDFQRLATVTQGAANTAPRQSPVVINEIMYHPISGDDNDEYVELYNRSGGAVNLSGWKLQGGISHTFPSNTVLAAGSYLVVAENRTNLLAKYSQLNSTNTVGNFNGTLADGGERVALAMLDDLISTNSSGGVSTNTFFITLDEVTYVDGGPWGQWSDGGGSSLELIDPDADNRLAANWADSDESTKAAWTTIDVTKVMENGQTGQVNEGNTTYGVANRFEAFLQGAGEVLLDDVAFLTNGGPSLIANGTFDSGTTGWTLGGVLRASYAEPGVGVGGSQALHLVAADRGDTGPNKVFTALTATAATGTTNTGTMRAWVRWLKGSPYILLRMRGNWMEVSQRLNVPSNCGSPGLPNSRRVANAGPAITDVSPSVVLPAAGQAVVISARANDPDVIGSLSLNYRLDPGTSYTSVTMLDNGTGGDAITGDGLYSATIPSQANGAVVAFCVSATDAAAAASRFPSQTARECLVRWGESVIGGSIITYRLWLTTSNLTFWASREKNANDPLDATFVYGNSRVFYNVDTLYSGSPFHAPSYNGPMGSMACDYEVNFPPDNRFLGSKPFVLTAYDVVSGNFFFNDDSSQVDLTGTWIGRKLGLPYNYRRHVHVVMNGLHRGTIYDDAQQPNGEMIDEYYPNDEHGDLRKIEGWFEFADNGLDHGNTFATIKRFNKSTGDIDAKRYRWNWRPRATDNPNDWSDFLSLVQAVNNTNAPNYESQVNNWMDVQNFLWPVVTHHVCGSWDSYAYDRGKNMFAYKPDNEPWRLMMWDIELALGAGGNGPTDSIYKMFDKTLLYMITNRPAFHRIYLRGFKEALDTALMPGAADGILDERYASFQQNNVPLISPQFIKTYITSRRNYLLTVIPNASFALTSATNQTVSGSNTVTLTGTGPLSVEHILINGVAYPLRWSSISNWNITVPLLGGTNTLNLSATDRNGITISNATGTVSADYTGSTVAPEGFVVLNEIQYLHPTNGGAFVELFNAHTNYTFDLSGWIINGLDYSFPSGTTLSPRSYLVLAEDAFAYNQVYGATNVAFAAFDGTLDDDGETLTLIRPDGGTNLIVVDQVRFEAAAPWPVITNGASLQLIDAAQDNSRVANWTLGNTNISIPPPSPLALLNYTNAWRYMQVSNLDGLAWTTTNFNDSTWPSGRGLLAYESNTQITPLTNTVLIAPTVATNGMTSGHAYYFRTSLILTNPPTGYHFTVGARVDDGAVFYVNGAEVHRLRMPVGTITNKTLASTLPPGNDALADDVFDIPSSAFSYGTNVIAAEVHQTNANSNDIVFGLKLDAAYTNAVTGPTTLITPGFSNSVAGTLPAFPPLWLNEVQAANLTGPLDNYSQHDPWTEIYNAAGTNVSLAGYYLSDNYTNLTKWALPAGTNVVANGFQMVWCDGETNQTAGASLHAAFRLGTNGSSLALSRVINGTTQLVDYLNYAGTPNNWSYGDVPDGQPYYRQAMFHVTPGATNNGASAPLTLFINEWMADNTAFLVDPADSDFEDWFELYNPGTNAVDLGGYYLTDNLTNQFKFQVPDNGHYVIPPGGYLLVWADDETGQNSTNRVDLHANFGLGKGGEAIGVFAGDGTAIDAIVFGAQTSNVSEGRFPDGAANIFAMPVPTPRAANRIPNTPPVLAAISNRFLTLGQTLTLTASATDSDVPVQLLSYSLPAAPAGAQMGSGSGVLTWTPSSAPSTNAFAVAVTDDGTPNLSATNAFTVYVVPRPQLGGITVNGTALIFSWPSVPGQSYQVEYKENLTDAVWIELGDERAGTGGMLSHTNALEGLPRSFFRVQVLP